MKKSNSIDTLRLRALHTACMTVNEIADKMNTAVENVEYELKKMGYTPIYKRDMEECHGFIKKEENNMAQKPRISDEKKQEIAALKAEEKSIKEITETTGVSKSTVQRVCKKEEPAPSANDTSSKGVNEKNIFTSSIVPEIPANVNPCEEVSDENFCCEVTPDTDMEAYMADREKIFAAKGHGLPTIVWEACMKKMEELNSKIKVAQSDIKEWANEISEISAFIAANSITTAEEVQQ